MKSVVVLLLAGLMALPAHAGSPTGEELREFRHLSQFQREQAHGAWQKTVNILHMVTRERRVPPDIVTVLHQQQQVLERAALEVKVLPIAATLKPPQENLIAGYQAESRVIDLLLQLLLVGELTPDQQTDLTQTAQSATLLIQEANRALEAKA
ncbi:hypothetical protein [Anthocerotibacter panamensis]|uniref:hypothetical protein n=1 Tax=Anthocerotibacter panamensis TaxID=2857077 RepID=UPI001C40816E|nr:hypothetical protein [Anthocerotibacter panamensis]